ncbi:related to nik-1 protein (Os-1p protein) [Serendipita indica DSM 11827]|uniref:histidine kinase n=1 Tax=Serendipita indica (strain DSM 11827) TaxID=1109443 RepID=G4TMH0_SERID|nr:related to nik-1 protein (Os-1p protein) [Serendipita indica DSM 11827]
MRAYTIVKYLIQYRDLYELDALQRAADEDDKSFIVTYARGEWNPSAIPEIPLGLHTILGLRSSNTGSRDSPTVPDGSHVSPPDLLESVEAVYRSYLEGYIQSTSETAIEELSPLPSNNPGLIEDGLIFPRRPADRSSIASASSSENFCSPIMSREALRRFERVYPYVLSTGPLIFVRAHEPMVIRDTLEDWRFKNNPTVTGAWAMRFYAGQPLRTEDGYHIGTICLIHSSPRPDLSSTERATLLELAGMVLRELETRRIEVLSFHHLIGRLAQQFASTLSLEKAFWIDVRSAPKNETREDSSARVVQERQTENPEDIINQLLSVSNGAVFNPGDRIPGCFSRLLRKEDSALAFDKKLVFLLSRSAKEPLAIVVVSTSDESYRFTLPPLVLTYFRSMGALVLPAIERLSLSLENKAKIDFIANISHEGLSDTLNHVLDFTKVNAQVSVEIRDTVDLAQLVEETMVTSWLGASAKFRSQNEIGEIYAPSHAQDKEKDVEPLIEIEALKIGNSLKGGYVKIALRKTMSVDANTIMVNIIVEDSGCGMSETFIREKLFHPFSQERPLSQGTGLGLALVRTILRSPGVDGTIDVHSKVGIGTRMTIRLKLPVISSTVSSWNRVPKPGTLPPLAICGFEAGSPGVIMAAKNLRNHLEEWYGTIPEVDISQAELVIVDRDHVDKTTFCMTNTGNPKCLVLCSAPVDPTVFQSVREYNETRNFCQILIKPFGPHALAVAMSAALDAPSRKPQGELKPSLFPTTATVVPASDTIQKAPTPHTGVETGLKSLKNLRILVVEDNPVSANWVFNYSDNAQRLISTSYPPFCEDEVGLSSPVLLFGLLNPDSVVLMDIQMPRMDGVEATFKIRALENLEQQTSRRLKIYALTGQASPRDKQMATEAGFDGYVNHLRVFGCLAYVFVPKSQRNALDSHTEKCIFVGYPSDRPGLVFWNLQTRKNIHSGSAVFDERIFPGTSFAKEPTPNLSDYIQLPDLEEINTSSSYIPPPGTHPPVHVAGRPVPAPIPHEPVPPPAPAPAQPKPTAPQRLSRELRALTDQTNFEKVPRNLPARRHTIARQPGTLTESDSDLELNESSDEDNAQLAAEDASVRFLVRVKTL